MMSFPRVFVIVVNWNGLQDTLECLQSLRWMDYPNFETIVVDNGSLDGSATVIGREHPEVTLIENEQNLGFTGGNNVGMSRAMELGADYMWLLNNDAIPEQNTLSKLVDVARSSPDVGLVSPMIYDYDKPNNLQYCGSYFDWKAFELRSARDPEQLLGAAYDGRTYLWGTALLVSRPVAEKVGYLSEKYFAYQEDAEYSLRAAKAGYRNVVASKAKIYHKGSASTGGPTSPVQVFLRARNEYFFWMDNLEGLRRLAYFRQFVADTLGRAGTLRKSGERAEAYEALLSGAWHAFRGIGGPWNPTVRAPRLLRFLMENVFSWHPYFWAALARGGFTGLAAETFKRIGAGFSGCKCH